MGLVNQTYAGHGASQIQHRPVGVVTAGGGVGTQTLALKRVNAALLLFMRICSDSSVTLSPAAYRVTLKASTVNDLVVGSSSSMISAPVH